MLWSARVLSQSELQEARTQCCGMVCAHFSVKIGEGNAEGDISFDKATLQILE